MGIRLRHAIPEALRVETRDLIVLAAVVAEDLAASRLERREDPRVRPDTEGVQFLSETYKWIAVGAGVPSWIVQDDVSEPVL